MKYLEIVAQSDVEVLREKEKTYGASWKLRGGAGAFMMLARKWDRLENMLRAEPIIVNRSRDGKSNLILGQYDVFTHIEHKPNGEDDSVLAQVRDLRRYLLLVEAEMAARGITRPETLQSLVRPEITLQTSGGGGGRTEHPSPFGYQPDPEEVDKPAAVTRSVVSSHEEMQIGDLIIYNGRVPKFTGKKAVLSKRINNHGCVKIRFYSDEELVELQTYDHCCAPLKPEAGHTVRYIGPVSIYQGQRAIVNREEPTGVLNIRFTGNDLPQAFSAQLDSVRVIDPNPPLEAEA